MQNLGLCPTLDLLNQHVYHNNTRGLIPTLKFEQYWPSSGLYHQLQPRLKLSFNHPLFSPFSVFPAYSLSRTPMLTNLHQDLCPSPSHVSFLFTKHKFRCLEFLALYPRLSRPFLTSRCSPAPHSVTPPFCPGSEKWLWARLIFMIAELKWALTFAKKKITLYVHCVFTVHTTRKLFCIFPSRCKHHLPLHPHFQLMIKFLHC